MRIGLNQIIILPESWSKRYFQEGCRSVHGLRKSHLGLKFDTIYETFIIFCSSPALLHGIQSQSCCFMMKLRLLLSRLSRCGGSGFQQGSFQPSVYPANKMKNQVLICSIQAWSITWSLNWVFYSKIFRYQGGFLPANISKIQFNWDVVVIVYFNTLFFPNCSEQFCTLQAFLSDSASFHHCTSPTQNLWGNNLSFVVFCHSYMWSGSFFCLSSLSFGDKTLHGKHRYTKQNSASYWSREMYGHNKVYYITFSRSP